MTIRQRVSERWEAQRTHVRDGIGKGVRYRATDADPRIESPAGYIPTLDGWRAVAVVMVVIFHASAPGSFGYGLRAQGFRGVDIFFGISGFLICSKLAEEEARRGAIDLKRFYLRRACRILPPAITYLAIVAILVAVGLLASARPLELLSCGFFFRNYLPPSVPLGDYTGHFWSLSVEEHFYLFLPGTLFLLGVRRARWFVPLTALAVAGWRFVDHRYDLFQHVWPTLYAHQRTDRTIDGLLWGATLAFAVASQPVRLWLERHLTFAIWTLLIAIYVTIAATQMPMAKMFEGMLIPLILFGTVIDPLGPVGKVLENRTIRWLGRISYSVYIWQTIFFVERFHQPALLQTFPYNVAGVISCACLSYYLVERPMIALGHRLTMPASAESNRRETGAVAFEGARGDVAQGAA